VTETGVAIVGARSGSLWTDLIKVNMHRWGYLGAMWPVSRSRREVDGMATFPSLQDLPAVPDAVVLATGSKETIELARTSVMMGVRHIVAIADGFAERGTPQGVAMQEELTRVVSGGPSRLYGPNCLGFADFRSGLCPLSLPLPLDLPVGNVSIVSQSGSLISSIAGGLVADGVGVDWCVSIGNGAAFDVVDALEYLVGRGSTTLICGYVESFGKASRERVERVLDSAREAGKHIVLIKAGASEQSAEIALSHTASVAGADRLIAELLSRHDVIRVADTEELVRTVTVLNYLALRGRRLQGEEGGVAVLEGSGGAAAQIADSLLVAKVGMAKFSAATLDVLQSTAPPGAYVRNPVDLTASPKPPGALDRAYETVYRDPDVATVFVPWSLTFPAGDDGRAQHEATLNRYCALTKTTGTPTILCAANLQRWTPWMRAFQEQHPEMLVVRGLGATVRALAHVHPERRPVPSAPDPARVASSVLGESEGRQLLDTMGVPLVAGVLWRAPFHRVPIVRFPCVVKAAVRGLAHRARLGAVVVGCRDAAEVEAARDKVLANLASAGVNPGDVEGLLVEEMVFGPELMIGFSRDPWYGPYVVLGRGGVNAEEQRQRVLDLPTTEAESILADSVMGVARQDSESVTATARLIGRLFEEFGSGSLAEFATVELNPVILTASGPWVVDVLLIRNPSDSARQG
jgi:acetate---CoA ligase (ADP-forming)